jgi:long-chain acyl-CoA synthetase
MIRENFIEYMENAILENWNVNALCNYKDECLTFNQTGNQILKLHQLFKDNNIKKGDKIALIGKNSSNWATIYLATTSYGAVIVPLLQDFKPKDIYNLINHSEAILLFGTPSLLDKLKTDKFENLNCIYSLEDFCVYNDRDKIQIGFNKDSEEIKKEDFKLEHISNDTLAAILYTSGTSGQPKGVMLNHNSLAANIRYARANMPLVAGDRILSFLPLAHAYGCAFEFLYPFTVGCTITFLGKVPAPNVVVKAFQEIKPKLILSVPLVMEKVYKNQIKPILNQPKIKILTKIPFVKKMVYKKIRKSLEDSFGNHFMEVVIGGAKLNREVEAFLKKIKFPITVGYGMTECGPLIGYDGWKTEKLKSAGKAIDCVEVKIDSVNPSKTIGEILIRGENLMIGYYKNPDITNQTIDEEGWMHSGDLGIIDEDGYIFIKGRNKSMILGASGKNIYPEEIESKLDNLAFVSECLVVGRDNKIIALIYPDYEKLKKRNIEATDYEKIINRYKDKVNEHLPKYMNINKVVIREEEFEKTPKKSIKRYLYA